MVNPDHRFHVVDYIIFGITIVVSLGIGLYYALSGGKQRTTSEYFVGNRKMAILPVAISLMVSFESSIMMLGTPAEVYVYGMQWLIGNIGWFLSNVLAIYIAVPLIHPLKITSAYEIYIYGFQIIFSYIGFVVSQLITAYALVPFVHSLKIVSAYEYLELRFESRAVRILGTVLGMLSYTTYIGIVLFGPAIALEGVTGFPQWGSIVSIALTSVIYTSIGGLKAVIWTDVFQCVVMFTGFFAVLIKGTMSIGGVGKTWEIAYNKGRLNLFNFDPDPTIRHTFWCLFVGSMIRGLGLIFNQSSVQRISSTPTVKDAKKVMLYVAPAFFLSLTLAGIEEIIAYAYYDTLGCDPLDSKQISNPNQIIPYMVMDISKGLKGLPGLFMASLFSASLSTLSSGLSSLSALFWTDLVKPHVKPMSEFQATVISKLSVFFFGALAVFVAFMIALVGGTLVQISGSLLSAFGGPLTGMFMFGAFCPWGNAKGVFGGTIIGAVTTFIIAIGQMTTKGAVKNQKLAPAPTDFCPVINASTALNSSMLYGSMMGDNTTSVMWDNSTFGTIVNSTMSSMTSFVVTSMEAEMTTDIPEPTGFKRLYMLSYQWFGSVGILQVFIFGTIISLCTGYKKPGEVPRRYLIPFYDSLFPFLPECIRRPLRCGYPGKADVDEDETETASARYNAMHQTNVYDTEIAVTIDTALQTVKNGAALPLDTATNGVYPVVDGVTQSIDDLRIRKIPVKDMELEILKTDGRVKIDGDVDTSDNSEFVVMDKLDDGRVLRFKAKSIEFEVTPYRSEEHVELVTAQLNVDRADDTVEHVYVTETKAETVDPDDDITPQ